MTKDKTLVKLLREQVNEFLPKAWQIKATGKKWQLLIRAPELLDGRPSWSKTLPFSGVINDVSDATELVKEFHTLITNGTSLDAAWQQLTEVDESEATVVVASATTNWNRLAQDFYRWREENGTQIKPKTMKGEKRYVSAAVKVLTGRRPPTRAYDLINQVAKEWKGKSRARQQAVEATMRFLEYGFDHHALGSDWVLPSHQKSDFLEKSKKTIWSTLSDQQILELIDDIPSPEWSAVLTFVAVFGLRPEELFHLTVRTNPKGERQFWCGYEKVCGVESTDQRWLHPLPLADQDGNHVHWGLVAAWDAGLIHFPPMAERGGALSQYLRRRPLWASWKKESVARGEKLRPYALRNSYSLRGHARTIPSSELSDAMGHSLAIHSSHYEWRQAANTAAKFAELGGGAD